MPRKRVAIPRVRAIKFVLDTFSRDHGVCIDCPLVPSAADESTLVPIYHEAENWNVIYRYSTPADLEANLPHLNGNLDHLDNFLTICTTHYLKRSYPNLPNPPKTIQQANEEALANYDTYSKPRDAALVSFQISRTIHSQIKAQASKERITASQLYRRLIDNALHLYLEPATTRVDILLANAATTNVAPTPDAIADAVFPRRPKPPNLDDPTSTTPTPPTPAALAPFTKAPPPAPKKPHYKTEEARRKATHQTSAEYYQAAFGGPRTDTDAPTLKGGLTATPPVVNPEDDPEPEWW